MGNFWGNRGTVSTKCGTFGAPDKPVAILSLSSVDKMFSRGEGAFTDFVLKIMLSLEDLPKFLLTKSLEFNMLFLVNKLYLYVGEGGGVYPYIAFLYAIAG